MIELLVFGVLAVVTTIVIGVVVGVVGLLIGLVTLPFRLLGWTFKLLGLAVAFPFLLLTAAILGVIMVILLGVAVLPLLPVLALCFIVHRLWRGRARSAHSQASVVS